MTQLYIDDQLAVIRENTSFKFNIDNQVFSDQGSYSLEIALPLSGCLDNQKIFKAINHAEVGLNKLNGTFRLITEVISYEGKYKIVEVNENEVKVQLLADKTLANAESKDDRGNKLYIDELDLGFFYDEYDWEEEIGPGGIDYFDYPPKCIEDYAGYFMAGGMTHIHQTSQVSNSVCFPIYATAEDGAVKIANSHVIENGQYILDLKNKPAIDADFKQLIAIQPLLKDVLRRIFKCLGFDFYCDNQILQNTYIANAKAMVYIADILPHWTINEFIREVCNFSNSVIIYDKNVAKLKNKSDIFNGQSQYIDDVIDNFSVNNNDDSAENFSASGNVDYDWPEEDLMLRMPDEIWHKAIVKHFSNFEVLSSYYDTLSDHAKELSRYLYIDDRMNNIYASLQNDNSNKFQLGRINWYPPLLRNNTTKKIQTKLRIVPVRMQVARAGLFIFDVPIMYTESPIIANNLYSINNIVKPDSDSAIATKDNEKRDVIEIFYYDGNTYNINNDNQRDVEITVGVMVQPNKDSGLLEPIKFLKEGKPMNKLGPYTLEDLFNNDYYRVSVDTKREYQFKFLKKGPLDVNKPFVIRGRRYICKSLQYDCTAEGVQPLILGYFYPLD